MAGIYRRGFPCLISTCTEIPLHAQEYANIYLKKTDVCPLLVDMPRRSSELDLTSIKYWWVNWELFENPSVVYKRVKYDRLYRLANYAISMKMTPLYTLFLVQIYTTIV